MKKYKSIVAERETEAKIMKRERDEYLTQKMEFQIENKKLKVKNITK